MSLLTRLFRVERPPSAAHEVLEPDERLTGWGTTPDGDAVMATTRGLLLPAPEGHTRLPWHMIHKATWDRGMLHIVPGTEIADGVVADAAPVAVQVAEPRDLPAEVRTRVTRSVAYSSYHRLPGGGVRVVARRVPGQDGLTWVLRFDEGVDREDPAVQEAAAEFLNEARALADVPQ
jgi:hypothetical protein